MRQKVLQIRQNFVYESGQGGAYEAIVLALCLRAFELHGQLKGSGSCETLVARVPGAVTSRMPAWYPPALVDAIKMVQQERRRTLARMRNQAL